MSERVWVLWADWDADIGIQVLGVFAGPDGARARAGELAAEVEAGAPAWEPARYPEAAGAGWRGPARDRKGRWVAVTYEVVPFEVAGEGET